MINRLKSILFLSIICLAHYAGAETFYVRPLDSSTTYGTETGTSYANAWNGFGAIQWGSGSGKLGSGDTLYVAGKHYETLTIGASGTSSQRIQIRGDYAPDKGELVGWETIDPGNVTSLGNNQYSYDTRIDIKTGDQKAWNRGRAFFIDKNIQLPATDSTLSDGVWYKDNNASGSAAYMIYFKLPQGTTPYDVDLKYSYINHAVESYDHDYFYIIGFEMYGFNSYNGTQENAVVLAKGINQAINYVTVDNNKIHDSFGAGIEIWNGYRAYIRHNEIYNISQNGIYLKDSTSYSYIQNNNIHNIAQVSRYSGGDHYGIAIGSTGNNIFNTVEYNEVSYVGDAQTGLQYDAAVAGWNASTDQHTTWRYNKIHDNRGGGLNLGNMCGGSIAEYNLIYNNGNAANTFNNGGIYIPSTGGSNSSVYVVNNTIANNAIDANAYSSEAQVWGYWNEATKLVLKNNIIITTPSAKAFIMPHPDNLVADGNIYYSTDSSANIIQMTYNYNYSTQTFSNYQSTWSQDTNSVTSNPQLDANLEPTQQSQTLVYDQGLSLGSTFSSALCPSSVWPNSVLLSDQNLEGSAWDIGAFLFSCSN